VKDSWVTFRPDIKILDCSVRDGGLMNNHLFDDTFVRAVYDACVAADIDQMEIGYKNSKRLFAPDKHGAWKYCDEDDVRRIVGENDTPLQLTAMADAEKCDYKTDILPFDQSVLDVIRVATYVHQIPVALEMIKDAHDKGYETTMNLMAVSAVREHELDAALELVAGSEVSTIYLVDSWGVLYSEQVQYLIRKYLNAVAGTGKQIGIHTHNNQQLAYANTVEAIVAGANRLDASICGIGRGAGNCPMELLIGFLHNPKFRLRPIIECIQNTFTKLRREVEWGYDTAYMITGQLNRHPRAAMEFLSGDNRDAVLDFYDRSMEAE